MQREVKNYIFIMMGCGAVLLIILFHLFHTINSLLRSYNYLVGCINDMYNQTFKKKEIIFFGEGLENVNLIVDLILVMVVLMIFFMIFLKIYWSVKYKNE